MNHTKSYAGGGILSEEHALSRIDEMIKGELDPEQASADWLKTYRAKPSNWAVDCNFAESPVGGAEPLPVEFYEDIQGELRTLATQYLDGPNPKSADFDYHAGLRMRSVVEKHLKPFDMFEHTAASRTFWILLSVYVVPDVIIRRWGFKVGAGGDSGADNVLSRFGIRRSGTLVRDTLSRIWWKHELIQAGGVEPTQERFEMKDDEWQERPSLFSYPAVAGHVAGVTAAEEAKPHGSSAAWAKAYGRALPSVDAETFDLSSLD